MTCSADTLKETDVTASPGREHRAAPAPTARIYQFPIKHEGGLTGDHRSPQRVAVTSASRWRVSTKALIWVWSTGVRGTDQHVLLALADSHNRDSGLCNPSMSELAEKTGLSERTIRRSIGSLLAAGVVEIENAHEETGRARGGRRVRARYRFVVRLETWTDRPPFANARVVIEAPETRSERPPKPTETRTQCPPFKEENPATETPDKPETRPNLHANPDTVTPLSLRDEPGYEPGTTAPAANASAEQTDGGLFAVAAPPKPINGGVVVTAWLDAWATARTGKPTINQRKQVGREARALIEAGNDPGTVIAAAQSCARKGFATLVREHAAITDRDQSRSRAAGGYVGPWMNPDRSAYTEPDPWGQP